MKRVIAILIILSFFGCNSIQKKTNNQVNVDKKITRGADLDLKIELKDKNTTKSNKDVFIVLTNKKTGEKIQLTKDEAKLMVDSWDNWKTVSGQTPQITKVFQDNKYLYIKFNYFKSNDKQYKKSILSGQIIINKKYLNKFDSLTKGIIGGTATYGVLMTIVCMLLIFL